MSTVTAFEAKTRFGELLERVCRGEEIIITRHEKPVARIIPEGDRRLENIRKSVAALRQLRESIRSRTRGKATLSDKQVRSAIEEGRL
jgi:prevent-host-death family protein